MSDLRALLRRLILAAAFVSGLTTAGSAALAEEWSTVRIASSGDFEPWNQTDAAGQLTGFEIDLANDLCARMGVECEFVVKEWDGIFDGLEAGEYDAIMAGVSTTDERKERFNFSDPYACGGVKFAVPAGSQLAGYRAQLERVELTEIGPDEQAALDDLKRVLKGKTVGALSESINTRFLDEFMADAVAARPYKVHEDIDRDLEAGRLDAALSALGHWVPLIEGGAGVVVIGPRMSGGPFGQGVGVVVRKDAGELAAMFSKAVQAANADGTLRKLVQQWFRYDASC